MKYENVRNSSKSYVFRKKVPAGESGYLDCKLVEHGFIESVRVRFAAGENATLQIRPVVIIPQEIMIDLLEYADNGEQYVTGDDELVESAVRCEIENKSILRVFYENTGGVGTADSFLNVDIGVTYFSVIEPENIIGPNSFLKG